jgi:hypothetical protein
MRRSALLLRIAQGGDVIHFVLNLQANRRPYP